MLEKKIEITSKTYYDANTMEWVREDGQRTCDEVSQRDKKYVLSGMMRPNIIPRLMDALIFI